MQNKIQFYICDLLLRLFPPQPSVHFPVYSLVTYASYIWLAHETVLEVWVLKDGHHLQK